MSALHTTVPTEHAVQPLKTNHHFKQLVATSILKMLEAQTDVGVSLHFKCWYIVNIDDFSEESLVKSIKDTSFDIHKRASCWELEIHEVASLQCLL